MSSLIPESSLVFSPQLAATIGLDEAILLPVLHNAAMLQVASPYQIAVSGLCLQLPFWPVDDIQRVLKSLSDKGIIQLLCPPVTQTPLLVFQFEAATESPKVPAATAKPEPMVADSRQNGAVRISANWQPSATVLAQLSQQNIPATFAKQQVANFVTYWRDRNEIAHSWNAKFHKYVVQEWQRHRSSLQFIQTNDQPVTMQREWQPDKDALLILQRNGISTGFIEDAIPEFILYWREKGSATTTWNSKFIDHVKRQWSKFNSALKYDTEPKRIPENWQPDTIVYDILKMSYIDETFAQSTLPAFILYWKDTNRLESSWNTKFLQHVKYCWSHKDELQRLNHEGQQNASGSNAGQIGSFIAKHTDRSWAEGL